MVVQFATFPFSRVLEDVLSVRIVIFPPSRILSSISILEGALTVTIAVFPFS